MKALLLTIGCLMALGGGYAIFNPRAIIVSSTGPAPGRNHAVTVPDDYSARRSKMTGYVSIVLGVGFVTAGLLWKKADLARSLDDL